jgi:hypothetical protein
MGSSDERPFELPWHMVGGQPIRPIRLSVRRAEKHASVLIPVLIFVVALIGGVVASSRWLPDLAAGQVGGLAFFVVCGLVGAGIGLFGVHIYSIVEELKRFPGVGYPKGMLLAAAIRPMVFEVGSLLGLASIVYLLAPRAAEMDEDAELEPAA